MGLAFSILTEGREDTLFMQAAIYNPQYLWLFYGI